MKDMKRHILGISGGKDSTALAIYMRDKIPDIEYFFCDTGAELKETYNYLSQLEKYLGKPIARLNPDRDFEFWLEYNGNFLPSARQRWCTVLLKLKPLEKFVGESKAVSYVGIRCDEQERKGYMAPNGNIQSEFPFIDAGIDKKGVLKILEDSGVGLPKYYEWRSRSGCYFCFFQRKMEWVGLLQRHPSLFKKAKAFEKFDEKTGKRFTWNEQESLEELSNPERVEEIIKKHNKQVELEKLKNKPLYEVFEDALDEEDDIEPCQICNL